MARDDSLPWRSTSAIRNFARAGLIKDADDPDVAHGALIVSTIRLAAPDSGIVFRSGEGGVGTVTHSGSGCVPGGVV
jgi:cobalt-precorrin-5B (C1)-methyltransferase